ncbi:MAG TPA: DUF1801 domain-containing protein [Gemmatimonadaceae bacterium]|nr:DUF1801 domain-containing protein [Gemmatimonadaceae bacterium]
MKKKTPPKSEVARAKSQISAYLAKLPAESRRRLRKVRADIRAVAPKAVDAFSYGIPGTKLDGRTLVWYGAFKHHTSLFPMTAGIRRRNAPVLKRYETSAGTVQFPLDEPLPSGLIKRLVRARVAEVRVNRKAKRQKKD